MGKNHFESWLRIFVGFSFSLWICHSRFELYLLSTHNWPKKKLKILQAVGVLVKCWSPGKNTWIYIVACVNLIFQARLAIWVKLTQSRWHWCSPDEVDALLNKLMVSYLTTYYTCLGRLFFTLGWCNHKNSYFFMGMGIWSSSTM